MPKKKQAEKEESMANLAKNGLKFITELAKSDKISHRLQAFNILIFVLISTINLTHFLGGWTTSTFIFGVIGVVCFILSLVCVLGYGPLVGIVTNISGNKVESLRLGITILFISLTFSVAGLTFNNSFLANLSLGLLGLQL
jgi:hypothetical protein